MAKCNLLGRGEARSVRKLEKAKGKIQKLKVCISIASPSNRSFTVISL